LYRILSYGKYVVVTTIFAKEEKEERRQVMNKRHRVQLSFSDSGFRELVQLEEAMGVTRQDLFKYALRWLQWTFEETSRGGKIQTKEPNGEVKEVVAPFLPLEPRKTSDKGAVQVLSSSH
jgi:hypothetical protein